MKKYSITKKAFQMYHSYNPKYFPLMFVQIIFENVSPYFNLWLSAEIVTALYEGRDRGELYTLVAVTLFGNLFIRVMGAATNRSGATQLEILENHQAAAFNHKTLSLDYDKIEDPEIRQHRRKVKENAWINSYGVIRMRMEVQRLMKCLVNLVLSMMLFAEMISLIVTVGFQWLGLVLFIAIVVCIALTVLSQSWSIRKITLWNKNVADQMLDENRIDGGYRPDGMDNRIYCQQGIISKLREKIARQHLKIFSKTADMNFVYGLPMSLFSNFLEICSFLIICFYCTIGAFPVGSVIKYVGFLQGMIQGIADFFAALNSLKGNEIFLKVYLDYFDIRNDMYQGSLAVEKRSDKKYDIEFKNVSFRYAGAQDNALKNISIKLKVGERLAVVGMNGSGKTTFIKLLCRLYDPTEGEIVMNDFNIRKYDYRQYLDIFSVVFQDFNLLAVPLGSNVASASVWDSVKAEMLLEKVGFGERYAKMPKGLDTPLYKNFDQDGVNISGGEAQKIALARALYRDTPFIILDEPTAALDPIAEAEIYAKFNEIVGDKTAVYISHRLSSCRFCDRIAVFDQGRIVQMGTHDELLEDETGKYHELWYAQAQHYT